jgi:hypothetical protein
VTLILTSPEDIDTIFAMHEILVKEYRWIEYNYNISGSSVVDLIESVDGYTPSYDPLPFDLQYDETLSFRVTYNLWIPVAPCRALTPCPCQMGQGPDRAQQLTGCFSH